MPALNQPIFRSNAIKHYMQGREKHEFPRFVPLPITLLLWALLAVFVAATALVWSEQVPTYATNQGIVVIHADAQPSEKSVSVTGKLGPTIENQMPTTENQGPTTENQGPTMEKSVSVTGKQETTTEKSVPVIEKSLPPTAMAVFFFPPAQAQNLHTGMPINLNIGSSGSQIKSQITSLEPGVMSPAALRTLFHLENTPLSINQPSIVVMVKLDPTLAAKYANSIVSTNLQVGSQRLISLLPGVGGLFGK